MTQTGDFLLLHESGLQSKLIQLGTGSYWNHVAIYTPGGWVEALSRGVVCSPLDKYGLDDPNIHIVDVGMDAAHRDVMYRYLGTRVGDRYNNMEIASIVFARLTGLHIVAGVSGEDICSGLCGEMLERGGYPLPSDGAFLTPGDLATMFGVVPR